MNIIYIKKLIRKFQDISQSFFDFLEKYLFSMKETWFCYILELFVLHASLFYQFDTSFKRPLSNDLICSRIVMYVLLNNDVLQFRELRKVLV